MKISIIDFDMGNPLSISNMLKRIGHDSCITRDHNEIKASDKLILPGVGSFDSAMNNLKILDLTDLLNEIVLVKKVPILGICLGMQILTEGSEEGELNGFGWIKGRAKKFDKRLGIKVPHMGWNNVAPQENSLLCQDLPFDSRFYFVHSYYVQASNEDHSSMKTSYSLNFDSAIEKENIFGVQFHPEKSHRFGMQIFKTFLAL